MALVDYGRIVGRAAYIRHKAGFFDKEPPYSTRQLMDRCFPKIMVTGVDLPKGIVEVTERRRGSSTICYARKVSAGLQRVGIIHGLHHLLSDLRHGVGLSECNVPLRELERLGKVARDPVELACDLFAGEILCPLDVLDQYAPTAIFPRDEDQRRVFDDQVDQLASKFNVPAGFIRWRLYDLIHLRKSNFSIR